MSAIWPLVSAWSWSDQADPRLSLRDDVTQLTGHRYDKIISLSVIHNGSGELSLHINIVCFADLAFKRICYRTRH